MNFDWKILEIFAVDGLITKARYQVTAEKYDYRHDGDDSKTLKVSTEGNWLFKELILKVPFAEVTEKMVIDWIKSESTVEKINIIEKRLLEQLDSLQNKEKTPLPWEPKVFTLQLED